MRLRLGHRRGATLKLRCFLEKRPNGHWYAHCIDLCLDAEAPSYTEARKKLDEVILEYVEWALPTAKAPKDIIRRSPLEFRFRYCRQALRQRLVPLDGGGSQRPEKSGESAFQVVPAPLTVHAAA